jgi:hypothetical protein
MKRLVLPSLLFLFNYFECVRRRDNGRRNPATTASASAQRECRRERHARCAIRCRDVYILSAGGNPS